MEKQNTVKTPKISHRLKGYIPQKTFSVLYSERGGGLHTGGLFLEVGNFRL